MITQHKENQDAPPPSLVCDGFLGMPDMFDMLNMLEMLDIFYAMPAVLFKRPKYFAISLIRVLFREAQFCL